MHHHFSHPETFLTQVSSQILTLDMHTSQHTMIQAMKFIPHVVYSVFNNFQEELIFKSNLYHAQNYHANRSRQKRHISEKWSYLEF